MLYGVIVPLYLGLAVRCLKHVVIQNRLGVFVLDALVEGLVRLRIAELDYHFNWFVLMIR